MKMRKPLTLALLAMATGAAAAAGNTPAPSTSGGGGYTPQTVPCPAIFPNCHDPVPPHQRYLPRLAELPVGATSAAQAVVVRSPTFLPNILNNPALPNTKEIAANDAKGKQFVDAVIAGLAGKGMLPTITDRPLIFTVAAIDLKGTMSQENPTSPSPCPGAVWSGWDATGWITTACAPAPPPSSAPSPAPAPAPAPACVNPLTGAPEPCGAPAPSPAPAPCPWWDPACGYVPPPSPAPAPAPAPSPSPSPAPAPAPSPAPAPAPTCQVLEPACEGPNSVRRDSCGNVLGVWANAPQCAQPPEPVTCPAATFRYDYDGSQFAYVPQSNVGTIIYGSWPVCDVGGWGAGCTSSGAWTFSADCKQFGDN